MLRTLGLSVLSGLSALLLVACVGAPEPGEEGQGVDVTPEGKGSGILATDVDSTPGTSDLVAPTSDYLGSATITNHGGGVMTGTVHAYVIWYGTWSATDKGIITNYLSHIGGTPHQNIQSTYGAATAVTLAGEATNNYSLGKNLTDANIQSIVSSAISGGLTKDTNGVYFVLTATDVTATSGFCTQYCGWHTYGTISGSAIKYSFVGNSATKCLSSCAGQTTKSPNNSLGVDAMISVIQHELEETITDPKLNAYYDSQGYENGDKCAWIFGTTSTAANGSKYNQTIGGKQYLVQQNWIASGTQKCASTYP